MKFATALVVFGCLAQSRADSDENVMEESAETQDESSEKLGPVVTQVYRHPYAATIMKNDVYECSAVILNAYWMLTLTKCFDADTSSYLNRNKMTNYTVRVGSSYNAKAGALYKFKMLINNLDLKVSAAKLEKPLAFNAKVQAVSLPQPDEEVELGYLASILAWTPDGHMRVVNVPVIEASICEDNTKLQAGHYVCVGGVQDPNRNFCRKDNGGAVIQNNTLIAIASFYQTCALYTRAHAFPKVSSFAQWLDTVIWDETSKPTTTQATTLTTRTTTEATTGSSPYYMDPSKFMLTLPYDPINLPLQPGEDNSVLPRISLYESYLQNMARAKTSTTPDPHLLLEQERIRWMKKFGQAVMMMPPDYLQKKMDRFDY